MSTDHAEAVLQSLRTAEGHVHAEYLEDLSGTLASVSREPRYAMMPEPGRVAVICDNEGVVKFYNDSRRNFIPGASRMVAQVATDWYVFFENVPTRVSAVDGRINTIHTTTLFPKAPDGIRGEFLWERYVTTDAPAGLPALEGAAPHVPAMTVRNLGIHEQYLDALCKGERGRIAAMLDEKCICAVRNYLPDTPNAPNAANAPMATAQGARESMALLDRWLDAWAVERVCILNRLATDWYVFAEELLVVSAKRGPDRGLRRQYRKATVYPINPAGRIQGELGYGTDLEAPSASADHTLGMAYFVGKTAYPGGKAFKSREMR